MKILLALLVGLASASLAPFASSSTIVCAQQTTLDASTCAGNQAWSFGSGSCDGGDYDHGGAIFVNVQHAGSSRGADADNGCYSRDARPGSPAYHGSYVGATWYSYDASTGRGESNRVHWNTGTQSDSDGDHEYCHAGFFDHQGNYHRFADCPVPLHAPVVFDELP